MKQTKNKLKKTHGWSFIRVGTRLAAALGVAAVLSGASALAQPVNDNFENATVLPSGLPISVTGSNVGATRQDGEPATVQFGTSREPTGARSIWWRWTSQITGPVVIATGRPGVPRSAGDFDTQLGVYTGASLASLVEVASNEDAIDPATGASNYLGAGRSEVRINATAGTTYNIMVNGWQSAEGVTQLHIYQAGDVPTGVTISVSPSPAVGGTATGGGVFEPGTSVTVTATPNAGFEFVNWTEGGTAVSTSAEFTFTAEANRTLVANFEGDVVPGQVTITTTTAGSGTAVPPTQTVAAGTEVTVTATPTGEVSFVSWRQGTATGPVASTDAAYTFTATSSQTLVAVFSDFIVEQPGDVQIVWHDRQGRIAIWRLDNGAFVEGEILDHLPQPGPEWAIVGLGDFNNNGQTDILWQHVGGRLAVWFMQGLDFVSGQVLDHLPQTDPVWRVVSVQDFTGNGRPDLLWSHPGGWLALWEMNGVELANARVLELPLAAPNWRVAGVTDFDGDGDLDILWQHGDGRLALWKLRPDLTLQDAMILDVPGVPAGWHVVSVSPGAAPGRTVLNWHVPGGPMATWNMTDTQFMDGTVLMDVPVATADWRIVVVD